MDHKSKLLWEHESIGMLHFLTEQALDKKELEDKTSLLEI